MCFQSFTTHIHDKNIVHIAKNVMKSPGWKCEWGSTGSECRVVLASWNAYLQHLLLHCKHGKTNDKKKYLCHLPRCNVPQDIAFFDSYEDLFKHIESSHMNRVPLVCPLSKCRAPMFSRPGTLEAHVSEAHQEIFGLPFTSSLLLPSWIPSIPQQKPQFPDLPTSLFPATILTGTCDGNWTTKELHQLRTQIIQTFPPASPKKYQKPGTLTSGGGKGPIEVIFADLLRESDSKWIDDLHANCLIQGRGMHIDLSRPQCMLPSEACIHKVPPKTIHYKVFEQQLEGSEGKDESLV